MIEKLPRTYVAIRDYTPEDKRIIKREFNRCFDDDQRPLSLHRMIEGDKRDAELMLSRMR